LDGTRIENDGQMTFYGQLIATHKRLARSLMILCWIDVVKDTSVFFFFVIVIVATANWLCCIIISLFIGLASMTGYGSQASGFSVVIPPKYCPAV
jgi:hypothetical protein